MVEYERPNERSPDFDSEDDYPTGCQNVGYFQDSKHPIFKLRFLHRSDMRAKKNGGLLLREKQARQLSTCLSKPLTAQRCSHDDHGTMEPWRTIEPLNH